MTAQILQLPMRALPPVRALPERPGLLVSLFGWAMSTSVPQDVSATPMPDTDVFRYTVLQDHLRHVRDLIDNLGPAEAVMICRAGLEAAEAAMAQDGQS